MMTTKGMWRGVGLAAATFALASCEASDPAVTATAEQASSIGSSAAARWPNHIKYLIDEDGSYSGKIGAHCSGDANIAGAAWQPLPAGDADAIRAALAEYSYVTPIEFEEIRPGEEPSGAFLIYTLWQTGGASHSSTGGYPSDGKPACVYLNHDAAIGVGTVLHETGHELGSPHEQKRSDAGSYVLFDPRCVDSTDPWQLITSGQEFLAPYDYDSIMEYASNEGCNSALPGCDAGGGKCAHPPLVKKIAGCVAGSTAAACQIGWNKDLSPSDVNVLHRAYEKSLGTNEGGDGFASALAVGDFDGDGFQDLAVGAPGEDVPGYPGGAVFLYKGTGGATAGTLARLASWKVLTPPGGNLYTHFGEALAVGDFDGDHVDDLAVSAPGAIGGGDEPLGAPLFVYSVIKLNRPDGTTSRKIDLERTQYWSEISLGVGLELGDRFGASLGAGDFDGDGVDDLAVGIPHRTVGGVEAGAVQILRGQSGGSFATGAWLTAASLAGQTPRAGDRFGAAVLARNFDPEIGPRADLIVDAPGSSSSAPGAAFVFRGTSSGITALATLSPSGASAGSRFGSELAAGDFDGRTVGGKRVPYLVVGADEFGGGWGHVHEFRRADTGFTFTEIQTLDEPSSLASSSDHFGKVLGAGAIDASGNDALLVGVPDHAGGGVLLVYRHTAGYPTPLQAPSISSVGVVAGDQYGSAVAVGDFLGVAGAQSEIVVGASGGAGGAGKLRLGDIATNGSISWQAWLDQESASPE